MKRTVRYSATLIALTSLPIFFFNFPQKSTQVFLSVHFSVTVNTLNTRAVTHVIA